MNNSEYNAEHVRRAKESIRHTELKVQDLKKQLAECRIELSNNYDKIDLYESKDVCDHTLHADGFCELTTVRCRKCNTSLDFWS